MAESRAKTIVSWVLVALLAAGYLLSALGNLTGASAERFVGWGYAPWFATVVGVFELTGAVGLLIPRFTRAATLGLTALMIGAVYTHIANAEGLQVLRPLIFLGLLWTVWWLRLEPRAQSSTGGAAGDTSTGSGNAA